MVVEFGSAILTSGSSGERSSFTGDNWYQQMHRGTASRAVAGRPDPAAECVDRVGAPVQADSVVGFGRFGGEALLEHPRQILRGDADAVVPALQVQLLTIRLAHDLCAHVQYPLLLARIAHCVRSV